MRSTGITRQLDDLGRIVIPSEIRKNLKLDVSSSVEFFVQKDEIIIKRFNSGCHCCNESNQDDLTEVMGLNLCTSCIAEFIKAKKFVDQIRK